MTAESQGEATASRDADIVKAHANTWASELQTIEFSKRKALHPETMQGPPVRVSYGLVKQQERLFDPILQRYRQPETEYGSRVREEDCRVHHLNRAMDIQLLREQPFNVINNASKLEGLAPDVDVSKFQTGHKRGRPKLPDTFTDFNILSNMPMSQHHWAPPDARPMPTVKEAKSRQVPTFLLKDFNIITNRYLEDHAEKRKRDDDLNLLECTAKYRTRNKFDPLTQKFNDSEEEERLRNWSEAHEVELVEQAQRKIPPSQKHRATAYYNPVNHEVCDGDMLQWMDLAEDERKERFKNKYIMEHNWHVQDVKADHIENERKLNKVSLARYEVPLQRGYCIVSHNNFDGRHSKTPYMPYSRAQPTVWDRACNGTAEPESLVPLPGRSSSVPAPPPPHAATYAPSSASTAASCPKSGAPNSAEGSSASSCRGYMVSEKAQQQAPAPYIPSAMDGRVPRPKEPHTPCRNSAPSEISMGSASQMSSASGNGGYHTRSVPRLPSVRHQPASVPGLSITWNGNAPSVPYRAPPAPSVPGSDVGSVYSKPCYAAAY